MDAILDELASIPGHKLVTWSPAGGPPLKISMIDDKFEAPASRDRVAAAARPQLAAAGATLVVRRTDRTRPPRALTPRQRAQCSRAHCAECGGSAAAGTPIKVVRGYAVAPGGGLVRMGAAAMRACFNTCAATRRPLPDEPAVEFE